jgi:hypothetical protein
MLSADIARCICHTASKSLAAAGRISIVVPSARSAYTPLAGRAFMPQHL